MKIVKLSTAHMYDDHNPEEPDYLLWKSIAEYMDGERAMVMECYDNPEKYLLLWLCDIERDKELEYMMEQDSVTGRYIDNRQRFEKDWRIDKYDSEICVYLSQSDFVDID